MRIKMMKITRQLSASVRSCLLVGASLLCATSLLQAGPSTSKEVVPSVPPEPPLITGTLSLLMDTHFVSYGQDIWGAGQSWQDPLFHPSLAINFNLASNFTFFVGTWMDINDNNDSNSTLGNRVQEIDVWAGVSYTVDKFKFSLTNQYWNYNGNTEKILDFRIDYANILNPYLLFNPTKTVGPVTLSLPVAMSYDTYDFHGGQAGFGYASVGLGATLPLSKCVSLTASVDYFYTNDNVIVTNPDEGFVRGRAGVVFTF